MRETLANKATKQRFLEICKEMKVSQVEISKVFDVSKNSVNRWFNLKYKAMPPLMVVIYLIKKNRSAVDWLIGSEE